MKKYIIMMFSLAFVGQEAVFGQNQPPIENNPPGNQSGRNSRQYWSRSGNTNQQGTNNVFGTRFNSPIYTRTSNQPRMKLNGSFQFNQVYNINGYNGFTGQVNPSGYMWLGYGAGTAQNTYTQKGAFSLLHLNGYQGNFVQEGGYRPWMRTGVTFTDNNDLSYIGLRKVGGTVNVGNGNDVTETVIAWSDNAGGGVGPDAMVFRFTSAGNGNTNISNDLTIDTDLDGRHIARFMPTGEFGLGNTFGVGSGLYTNPRSLLHLSLNDRENVWSQYTNQEVCRLDYIENITVFPIKDIYFRRSI